MAQYRVGDKVILRSNLGSDRTSLLDQCRKYMAGKAVTISYVSTDGKNFKSKETWNDWITEDMIAGKLEDDMITILNIKTGMLAELRNGCLCKVLRDIQCLAGEGFAYCLGYYRDDLTNMNDRELDIMKIYKPLSTCAVLSLRKEDHEPVWERK